MSTPASQSEIARRRKRTATGMFAREETKPQNSAPEVALDLGYSLRDIAGVNGADALRKARAARRAQVERLLSDGLAPGIVTVISPGYTRNGALKWSLRDDETMTLREGIIEKTDSPQRVEEDLPIDVLIVSREALARREQLAAHRRTRSAASEE
ncbi:hypothetical protein GCM10022288_15580 [Gryllotalpicola kribbensis]|uniref:Uncharacterized protein n=1 Tax=Gryllotalpicola kribbensis TaxID=993084 RepID=A0ABP8AS84_9MICO